MQRSLCIISLVLAPLISAVLAQTNVLFSTSLIRDDNAFQNRETYDDWITTSSFQIGYQWAGENYRLSGSYAADYYAYSSSSNLSSLGHKLGLSGTRYAGDFSFYLSGYAHLQNYSEDYFYYDVDSYDLHTTVQYEPDLFNVTTGGFQVSKDRYSEFDEINNIVYRGYGQFQHFFQNQTSLTVYAAYALKNYVNQSTIRYVRLRRIIVQLSEDPIKASLFSTYVNIGKSLLPGLGVNLLLGGQWFVGDPVQVYSPQGIYYYTENDLYDDPQSYQGGYISLQMTKQFAVGFQARVGVKFQNKDYAGIPALDENGDLIGETRLDKRQETFFYLTKKFQTGLTFPATFDVFLNVILRQNPSNDPYYDYKDTLGLLGFSVGF